MCHICAFRWYMLQFGKFWISSHNMWNISPLILSLYHELVKVSEGWCKKITNSDLQVMDISYIDKSMIDHACLQYSGGYWIATGCVRNWLGDIVKHIIVKISQRGHNLKNNIFSFKYLSLNIDYMLGSYVILILADVPLSMVKSSMFCLIKIKILLICYMLYPTIL